jgi:hypothetical protein
MGFSFSLSFAMVPHETANGEAVPRSKSPESFFVA